MGIFHDSLSLSFSIILLSLQWFYSQMMKDSLVRSFNNFEPDILKQSSRAEWPVMLHNLCYLHAAIQLRTRYGFGGWNCPTDFRHIGNFEIQVSICFLG